MAGRHRTSSTPRRRAPRVTETSDFVAMMTRQLAAWGERVGTDPAALVHLRELEAALVQQTNRGIFLANQRGQYSQNHMAAILGTSRQAIAKRITLGQMTHAALVQVRDGGAPLVRLGEVRARRARLLRAAGVPDMTGSERELRAVGE